MTQKWINTDAPILPDVGLAGLSLRSPIIEAAPHIDRARNCGELVYELPTPYEARYRMRGIPVEIGVDVRNGKIFRLTAYEGYLGTLFGRVRVGMRAVDVLSNDPRLYFDEAEGMILCEGVPGVCLELSDADPIADWVNVMSIDAISVYAQEITTRAGFDGTW